MSELIKLPHEISLWDDRLVVVGKDGQEYDGFVDASKVEVVAQYYKEVKLCVIGSNAMNSSFSITEPNLIRNTDGTSTLTFSIYSRYYDEELEQFVENPFIKYLTNERKVKLKYYPNGELRWLDFIIKKISESNENYKFTYTATDLFINELSKTGYNLEFDRELENNQGTAIALAEKVLDKTDWKVGASELLRETKEEPLYKMELNSDLAATDLFTKDVFTIKAGENIYTFYSTITEENGDPDFFQIIYDDKEKHIVDENNVLQEVRYCYCKRADVEGLAKEYYKGFRGLKYIRSQKTEYDKVLEEYVKLYQYQDKEGKDKEAYGYVKTEYFAPSLVTNYITNGKTILSSTGWDQQIDGPVEVEMNPPASKITSSDKPVFGLKYERTEKNTYLLNSGFRDNAETIKELTTHSKFVFRIKAKKLNDSTLSELDKDVNFSVRVFRKKVVDSNGKTITEESQLFSGTTGASDTEGFLYVKDLSPAFAVSYEELTDITRKDKFQIEIKASKDGTYHIQEVQLFQQNSAKNSEGEEIGIILPDGKVLQSDNNVSEDLAEAYTKTTYYYYDKAETEEKDKNGKGKTDPEQIEYLYIGDEEQAEYVPVYDYNYEKIRSISKKESNRFDLLQTISENFKCWCRFDVWHSITGEILLGKDLAILINSGDAFSNEKIVFLGGTAYSKDECLLNPDFDFASNYKPYEQLKFVTFHNKIGQKKNIGFRYGTNLKSIVRSLDSNSIATKLIVKSNTNEFANGGSCNIALAKENPSGENFVYDFSYYINQGLLNEDNLNGDLYYIDEKRGWIGLYAQLKPLNKQRDALITELTGCTKQYANSKSNLESAKLISNASEEELKSLTEDFYLITQESYPPESWKEEWDSGNKLPGIVYNINLYKTKIDQAELDYAKADAEMKSLEDRMEEINASLKDIETQTANLISEFETKYIRFIQEASWTSEDYVDDNLYYLDAETTLHKASQPKVSYTINVIELSQLEEYKDYVFDLGDITYVQDPDFFGWEQGKKFKTPRKEEIVITEMQTFFHNPEKSTIKVQNYRTAFEDLFKRLTASAQQIQFHSGEFQRAADIVDGNGNIAPSCLEDAFSNNAFALSNVANQSVQWDEQGITTTDTTNPAEITRITSGGIFLSNTGGEKWTTGITANGINAKVITTGQLDTGKINIYNGAQRSFAWDSQGLNAYRQNPNGGYNQNEFVRFNQYGIYGMGEAAKKGTEEYKAIQAIKGNEKCSFYLGRDGLHLNSGYLNITNGGNSVIINPKGFGTDNTNKIFEVKKGDKAVMSITTDGDATFSGKLVAATGEFTGKITAGTGSIAGWNIGNSTGAGHSDSLSKTINLGGGKQFEVGMKCNGDKDHLGHAAFYVQTTKDNWANRESVFLVTHDGKLTATEANITGSITATSGTIAGFNIGAKIGTGNNQSSYTNALSKRFMSGSTGYEVGMKTGVDAGDLAFYVKKTTNGWTKSDNVFFVKNTGEVLATSGSIGGWLVDTDQLLAEVKDEEGVIKHKAVLYADKEVRFNNDYGIIRGPMLEFYDLEAGYEYTTYITPGGILHKNTYLTDYQEFQYVAWHRILSAGKKA